MGKIKAIKTYEDWQKPKGIYFLGEGNENEIVITKNDPVHVRDNRLYFNYKGIAIYADIDNIIYIDKNSDTIQIIKHKELAPPEQREYLLLLVYHDEELENTFQGYIGRQNVFDFIKSIIEEIDIEKSLIIAETVQFKDALNIYEFMKECILNDMVLNDDGFDIEEYIIKTDE